jgi:HSP20 family protein
MNRPNPRDLAAPLNALQDELHRLFDRYRGRLSARDDAGWAPAVDVYETPEEVGLLVDLPGVDPAAVELSVNGRVLTLRGEKRAEEHVRGQGRTLERPSGPFCRQIDLDSDVDVDAAQATADRGVLHVRLPKVEAARPHIIPIRTTQTP